MDITESVQNEANQLEKKIEVHEARAMWETCARANGAKYQLQRVGSG